MPGMNGLQVVETLRRSADSARAPIIMMSGRCTEDEGDTLARINGFAGFVQKPISPFDSVFGVGEDHLVATAAPAPHPRIRTFELPLFRGGARSEAIAAARCAQGAR